jgi:hypothetical protein
MDIVGGCVWLNTEMVVTFSQPTFGGLPGGLFPSQVFSHLVVDISRPALMVLTPPAAALAVQDDELTLPITSPVVASLSPFLTADVSRSIEKDLIEAELLHAQSQRALPDALIQADVPGESDSMLPLMPSLDQDAKQEDKEKNISQATKYHAAAFHDPYSDDDDGLLDDDNGFLDLKEEITNIEEGVDLLINLKSANDPITDKNKDRKTNKKKPKSKRKQFSLPLQALVSPPVAENPKPKRRTSPRRAELLAKEAELVRVAEALAREQVVAQQAFAWLKSPPAPPKNKATARLKRPPVYAKAAVAAAAPSGHGDGDDDSTDTDDTDDHTPFPAANEDDNDLDKKSAAKDIRFPDPADDKEDNDNNDNDDDKDNDGDGDDDNDVDDDDDDDDEDEDDNDDDDGDDDDNDGDGDSNGNRNGNGDGDGDNHKPETPARDCQSKSHKKRPCRASRGLLQSTLKKKISREIKNVCEGQLLYIALWPFKPVKTKKRKSRINQHSHSLPRS